MKLQTISAPFCLFRKTLFFSFTQTGTHRSWWRLAEIYSEKLCWKPRALSESCLSDGLGPWWPDSCDACLTLHILHWHWLSHSANIQPAPDWSHDLLQTSPQPHPSTQPRRGQRCQENGTSKAHVLVQSKSREAGVMTSMYTCNWSGVWEQRGRLPECQRGRGWDSGGASSLGVLSGRGEVLYVWQDRNSLQEELDLLLWQVTRQRPHI